MPPTSSPVPRLASVPSAALNVHTIASAHHLATDRTSNQDERRGGHPVRFWAMSSPHLATTSQRPGQRLGLSVILPPSSPSSSTPSGGESRAASQTGRAIPQAHPVDPLHPAGVRPNICGHLRREGRGSCRHNRAAGLLGEKFCFGIFCAVVSL